MSRYYGVQITPQNQDFKLRCIIVQPRVQIKPRAALGLVEGAGVRILNVQGAIIDGERGLVQGLRERGMRVNGACEILG